MVHEILKTEEQPVCALQTGEPQRIVNHESNRKALLVSVIVENR